MSQYIYDELVELCKEHDITLSTCESVTGGMIASYITKVSGASKVFKGGLIVYSNQAKEKLAHVKTETLKEFGAISKETAIEMAYNTCGIFKSTIAISITGNAGPNPDENKEVGKAYLGICLVDKVYIYELITTIKDRKDIQLYFTNEALKYTLELIRKVIK